MKKYICIPCGWIYDPEVGDPDGGIAPGTAFEDIPDDWTCPLCGVTKDDFEEYEEQYAVFFIESGDAQANCYIACAFFMI